MSMSIPSAAVATRPISDIDPFSNAYILDPYPFHEQLREAGPLVWLQKWDVWAVTRYEQVKAVLTDWKNFCSSGGVGLSNFRTERPWRTLSLLLETDPPDHTRHREVVGRLLSPSAVRGLRDQFEREAQKIIESVLNAGPFDAIPVLAEAYPLKAFGDAVGVVPEGRSHLVAWGNMVFNTMGPRNEHYERSLGNSKPVFEWLNAACRRENLSSDGLGAQIYTALDDGIVSEEEAPLHVGSFLSAGVDTTTNAIANALFCFARHPEQWRQVRNDPTRVRAALEESLRFEAPFQTFFRTATCDIEIAGTRISKDQKMLISVGSANRDPRRWTNADTFDVNRKATGHFGFGAGIHGCVGQAIARLEVDVLLTELAKKVKLIDLCGEPVRLLHNTLRGFDCLPIALRG
jgi:4-methoxybenzoate monooxygenase (O-demethylating)